MTAAASTAHGGITGGDIATPTLAAPNAAARGRQPAWPSALVAVISLIYLLWAGSAYDPRNADLWTYVGTGPAAGWIAPAPGLGNFWIAAGLVFASLSVLAYRTFDKPAGSAIWQCVIGAIIIVVALDVRLIAMGGLHLRSLAIDRWIPLTLNPDLLQSSRYTPAFVARGPAILADFATLAILIAALAMHGRSLWPAALFAWHPLAIMQSAGNGSHAAWLLPLLALLAMGWRLHKWLREILIISAAAACVGWLAHLALSQKPFDGLLAEILATLGLEGTPRAILLILIEIFLQAVIVVLALRRNWNLAKTLAHILIAWAIVSPVVMPEAILPILVLLPLAAAAGHWNRAGWVLSGTILWVYAIAALWDSSQPKSAFHLPAWLSYIIFMPPLVLEIEELLMAAWNSPRKPRPLALQLPGR